MNYKIVTTFPHAFFENAKAPLISIYQDTSRYSTDNKHDVLTFKNLVNWIETSLLNQYDKSSVKPVIELLRKIQDDRKFWQHCLDGMALFSNLDECIIYDLKKSPETVAVVSDSFHITPSIQYFQFFNIYQILDLFKASFQIFEGDAYSLQKIDLSEDVETTIEEILGRYSETFLS